MDRQAQFGPVHTIDPQSNHTHTVVMLHGRGSNGPEFAEELLETCPSDKQPITRHFPGLRWVFPSSKELWSTAFEEPCPAWFEAHSLTDITARQDLQVNGIRDSLEYLQRLIDDEVLKLGGDPSKLLLGGISQGGAIGLWTLLSRPDKIGAFFGVNTWLPFASMMEQILLQSDSEEEPGVEELKAFVRSTIHFRKSHDQQPSVFLGHGLDDAFVNISLGRQAQRVLSEMGISVQWNEYTGAELEGHWFKVPEEMDDICQFIQTVVQSN